MSKIDKLMSLLEEKDITILNKIANAVKGFVLVDMRDSLEGMFDKKDVDFSYKPFPHFTVTTKDGEIVLINKKYVDIDDSMVVEGETAIGFM